MALADIVIAHAQVLRKDPSSYALYRQWVERLEELYGFLEDDEFSENLAFTLITLTERYGNKHNVKELRELHDSLLRRHPILVPMSSKTELPLRKWLILFVATQLARRL